MGQPKVKLLRNVICLLGVIRGQLEGNCLKMHGAIKCSQCYRALCSCRCSSTIKIMESVCGGGYVCVCVCVCVCPAMRFVMLPGTELKVGMGVGDRPTRFVGIFSKRPHLGSKVIQKSICFRNALWLPNLVKRTPGQSIVHCWGQRSCKGHQGSMRGQIA